MYDVEYFARRGDRQPIADWLDGLDKKARNVIIDKIQKLGKYGLELIRTEMLKTISGDDSDFYELRGGQCRVAAYYARRRDAFGLLHGWLKKKQVHKQDIEQARRLLHEYLSGEGE